MGHACMASKKKPPPLTVMVSSTVYGQEKLLDQIYASLRSLGYTVWMSHKGTLPINPKATAFDTCLEAVESCDIFLGIISPYYGSGKTGGSSTSITHRELVRAIERGKLRWVLAHEHVVNSRRLLMDLGFKGAKGREELKLAKGGAIIDDLRLMDMYEAATREELPLDQRTGNWVQKFRSDDEALLYIVEQFSDEQQVRRFLAEPSKKAADK